MKSNVFWVFGDFKLKFLEGYARKIEVFQSLPCLDWRLEAPKLNRAETVKLNLCALPSEMLGLQSSNTNDTTGPHTPYM